MRRCILNRGLLVLLSLGASSAQETPEDDFNHFVTEPTFRSNRVTVTNAVQDKSLLEPGYIFFAPFPDNKSPLNGPQIVDQDGHLIWYGNATSKARVQGFHACNYLEKRPSHLCWSESEWTSLRHVRGSNRIFDNTYAQVGRDYGSSPPLRFPNPHEFNIVPKGNSFLQSVYQLKLVDLTTYGGQRDGYILDGCFQEVDIQTGDATFTWCGTDHLDLWQSYVYFEKAINDTGEYFGQGVVRSPWDYFHLNAIDKNEEGDYFISARHLDQILKVAGNDNVHGVAPGTILWRLGGKFNEFENYNLLDISRQHHVRHLQTTSTETTISLFNNQWFQNDGARGISNAQIIVINNQSMSVTDVRKYHNPEGLLSAAQGSTQVLPNDNVFVGWGFVPHVSEFSSNGTLLYHAHLANYTPRVMGQTNYRAFKFNWSGKPTWPPKLVAYSHACASSLDAPMVAYASWNGATDVRFWRFYTSQTSRRGPWLPAGTFERTGFETKAYLRDMFGRTAVFAPFVSVEALGADYSVLSRTTVETFVPGADIASQCEADGCLGFEAFEYNALLSAVGTCPSHARAYVPVFALIAAFCLVEYVIILKWNAIVLLVMGRRLNSLGYRRAEQEAADLEVAVDKA